jgi:Undecaprenyl-phosphate glucose phosphotransferase
MLKRYQHTVGGLFRVMDACVMTCAWLGSYWARFFVSSFFPVTKGFPHFATYASLSPLVAVLWTVVFTQLGAYESRRMLSAGGQVRMLLKAHGVALLLFIAITYLFEEYKFSRLVMLYFAVIGAVAMVLFRMAVRLTLHVLRVRGHNLRWVLAVGEGEGLDAMIDRTEAFPELGLRVRGVVTQDGRDDKLVCGKPVVGKFDELPRLIDELGISEVIISLPPLQQQEVHRLLDLLHDETVDVRLVPDVQRHATLGCEIEDFDGLPVMRINDSPLFGMGALAKRLTDVVVAVVALIVLSPLLLAIGIAVKLTSRGPMLYAQERMGLDGRTFKMFKFRSMRTDAEARTGAVWAQAADDRRTPIGAFLRQTSLDELPQLWNILSGDMSVVGPRPERPVFVNKFRKEVPHYMLRHKVKAGLTGWAQVNGWRGNTSLDRRIECDLFYIRNWSYSFDLKIITLTLWKGFIHKNAY